MNFPSKANAIGVFPCWASSSPLAEPTGGMIPSIYFKLPPDNFFPSSTPHNPFPGKIWNCETGEITTPCFSDASIMAFPRGCSLCFSSEAAYLSNSTAVTPSAGRISVTEGCPLVIVPVLSSATYFTFPVISSEVAFLKRIPLRAPMPVPTIMATGVASPRAQGQLITRTEIPLSRAYPSSAPASIHTTKVIAAIAMMPGTNTADTLSATFAIGALDAEASLTICMILERRVSSPTLAASHLRAPWRLIVPCETFSPTLFSTGMLSPVSADSFTELNPSTTLPSAGIVSPGRTMNTSPTFISSTGTLTSFPSLITVAFLGDSFTSASRASVVFPLAFASSSFPTEIRVSTIAADSK